MAQRRPYVSGYSGIDSALLQRVPEAQQEVVFSFAEVAALLAVPAPLSALTLEERFETQPARRHWQRLGFAATIDWLARRVVFTRLERRS